MRYYEIKQTLNEGVKFGKRELNQILETQDSYRIGIEYEFHANNPEAMTDVDYVIQIIKNEQLSSIGNVHSEHDNMTEVVTTVLGSLSEGFQHIKQFINIAEKYNFSFPETAGMHISISHKDGTSKKINLVKFAVLLAGDYIHSIFPERHYVNNIKDSIRKSLTKFTFRMDGQYETRVQKVERIAKSTVLDNVLDGNASKYITAKVSDFLTHDGRIELRFIGGKNYHERLDDIKYQVIRACFILGIAYDDQLYRREYIKSLMSLLPEPVSEKYTQELEWLELGSEEAKNLSPSKIELIFNSTKQFWTVINYLNLSSKRHARLENIALQAIPRVLSDLDDYLVVATKDNSRWIGFEEKIINSMEDTPTFSSKMLVRYLDVISPTVRLPELEEAMLDVGNDEFIYTYMVMRDPLVWKKGIDFLMEENINRLAMYIRLTKKEVEDYKNKMIEQKNVPALIRYAQYTEQGRMPEIEELLDDTEDYLNYYKHIIDGVWDEGLQRVYVRMLDDANKAGIRVNKTLRLVTEMVEITLERTDDPESIIDQFIDKFVESLRISKHYKEALDSRINKVCDFASFWKPGTVTKISNMAKEAIKDKPSIKDDL